MGRGPAYGVRSDGTGQRTDQPNQGAQETAGWSGQFHYIFALARLIYILFFRADGVEFKLGTDVLGRSAWDRRFADPSLRLAT